MKFITAIAILTSSTLSASEMITIAPKDHEESQELAIEYYNHDDVHAEILAWEKQTHGKIESDIEICIERDCQYYYHKENSDYVSTFNVPRKAKKPDTKPGVGAGSGIKPILNAISKGISGGAKLKVGKIKVNADGSYEINDLEMWAGAGIGADVPVPGSEDGKQTDHY